MDRSNKRPMIPKLHAEGKTPEEIAAILGYKNAEYVKAELRRMGALKMYKYNIDVPKVIALRKAGWHMAEIRREFLNQYTADQIIEAVYEYDRQRKEAQDGKTG